MTIRSMAAAAAATGFGLIFLFTQQAAAQNGAVRVLVSNGVKAVVEELQPQCERAAGHPLAIQFGTTASLKQKIEAGEAFDVALLGTEAIDDLAKAGKIAGGGTPMARCGIGVGIRAGQTKPDIHSPEALRLALQETKSISYAQDGASRVFIEKMVEHMGIASDIKTKTMLTQGSAAAGINVASGKAGMVLTLISEILPMPGVQLVGPLPAAVQSYVSFSAGVSANATYATAGKALIQAVTGPKAAAVYKAKGMEPR
jgi:molybdate transport system substrate-binding protein